MCGMLRHTECGYQLLKLLTSLANVKLHICHESYIMHRFAAVVYAINCGSLDTFTIIDPISL